MSYNDSSTLPLFTLIWFLSNVSIIIALSTTRAVELTKRMNLLLLTLTESDNLYGW